MEKVLVYILSEGKGGVEEYVMNLSRFTDEASNKYGYLVMGESTVYESELKGLGIDYYFVPKKRKPLANIIVYKKLFKHLRSEYSTIYFNTSGLYYPIPYLFAIAYGYRIVLHSHSTAGSKVKTIVHKFNRKWINKFVSNRLSCSIPAGKWMFGEKWEFKLIPNAIDLEKYKFNFEYRCKCRTKYNLGDSFVLGTVGRLHWGKNQLFLIEILKELIDRDIKAVLLLVGDGNMKEKIVAKAKELDILDKVVLSGQTNNSEEFYSAMDCFLLPSFAEGFPVTLIEAQANGLPCFVSDRVTQETNVSGRIKYLSIDKGSKIWVDELISNIGRYDCISQLREKGYDVKHLDNIVWPNLANES